MYFCVDEMWSHKNEAIASNYNFSILIKKNDQYRSAKLVVSGLPILALNSPPYVEGEIVPQRITLLGPDASTSYEGFCTSHVRGQTAATYPKFGYKIELCDEQFNRVDFPLLGLRSDDDWIINALYGDSSKIREKMAYQIWEEIQEYNRTEDRSSNITHVELIFEDIYWGIYGLQEPVDQKQLSMDEADRFFRKTDLVVPESEDFIAEDGQEYIPGFRIKYPQQVDVKAEDWLLLQPFVEAYYYDCYSSAVEVGDIETLTTLFDFSNAMDYKIFVAVVSGDDNIFKNLDYCLRYENGQYIMHVVPWDLNATFGDEGFGANATYNPSRAQSNMSTREYIALYRADNELVESAIREKWAEYRRTFLSTEYLREMADAYMGELEASGAMFRDNARWPECENSTDLTEIYDYIERHMVYLDECFAVEGWWQYEAYLRRSGE